MPHLFNKLICWTALIITGLILTGCAASPTVLPASFWQNPPQKVSIITVQSLPPRLYNTDDSTGLISVIVNESRNKNINKYLANVDISWYKEGLPAQFVKRFKQRKIAAEVFPTQLKGIFHNHTVLANQLGTPIALILQLDALGATGEYSEFVPVKNPRAYCLLSAKLINLQTSEVLWHQTAEISQPVYGTWNQPPNFPNLDHALTLAVKTAQQQMLDSFFAEN